MDYDEVVVNKRYNPEVTEETINRIIEKPGKLDGRDIAIICNYFGMTLPELIREIRRRIRNKNDLYEWETCYDNSSEDSGEYTTIVVPLLCDSRGSPKKKRSSKSPRRSKRSKRSKRSRRTRTRSRSTPRRRRKVSYQKVKDIVSKKKIKKEELKDLAQYYSVASKQGLKGIWFAAAKKGHLSIMKQLYKKKHIRDPNMTNHRGITAEEIAEKNKRGHVSKWLATISTMKVAIQDDPNYKFKQAFSESDDSSESTESE